MPVAQSSAPAPRSALPPTPLSAIRPARCSCRAARSALAGFASPRGITLGAAGGVIDTGGNTVVLQGSLSGPGGLTETGGGVLALNGASSLGGAVAVAQGQLSVNGTLSAAAVNVGPLGILRGIGSIAAPTAVAGTLAPGNSPGTLTFAAAVTQQAGSVLAVDIDGPGTGTGAGNFSRVLVQGAGGTYTIQPGAVLTPVLRGISGFATNGYTPPLGQTFLVVQADGGVSGGFSTLTQPSDALPAGARMDAMYGASTITLVVTPSSYAGLAALGLAETPNQSAVGAALDSMRPAAGTAMPAGLAGLFNPLYLQGGGTLGVTLDELAPTIYGDALMTGLGMRRLADGAVFDALDSARGSESASAMSATLSTGATVWLGGLGQFNNVASDAAPGYRSSVAGTVAGVDVRIDPSLVVGSNSKFAFGAVFSRCGSVGGVS
jgi:subtilase-type serine protease